METGNRLEFKRILKFKVCTRRRSWVQQTVDQRRRVVVATQGRRAHWITIDSSLRFEVSFYESKMYFFYFWSWWSAQKRTQQRFAKLKLKKASSAWKTEIWNIQKNADATIVMIMRWNFLRTLDGERIFDRDFNSLIYCRSDQLVPLFYKDQRSQRYPDNSSMRITDRGGIRPLMRNVCNERV